MKTALITGAASGIGLAIAERLHRDGVKLVLSDLNAEALDAAAARFDALAIAGDLSERSDCRALCDAALSAVGHIDILVNNAGFQHIERVDAFPEDTWDRMLALMLTAPFLLSRYCLPAMRERGWGRIINVASVHGLVASPYKSAYISAKHGLLGLTKTTALEVGADGVTVNAICPAYVRTPLVEKQIADQARTRGIAPEQVIEQVMLEPAAIKRLVEPSEVAEVAAFLIGDAAGVCTGASWVMDLGWTSR